MFNSFNNNAMCGGTSTSNDENAPKEIISEEMTFFRISAALGMGMMLNVEAKKSENDWIDYISVYAALLEDGVLLTLNARNRYDRNENDWGIIKDNIFPGLVKVVREQNLAAGNGRHSFTYGLPENFGGDVLIKYASGEQISYSNNQSPIITKNFGIWLYEYFCDALKKERVAMPDASMIAAVSFYEQNSTGYVRAELKKNPDDTYELYKAYKFEEPQLFEYRDTVSADVLNKIREIADERAVLIWNSFPRSGSDFIIKKTLTFILENGDEISVTDDRVAPAQLSNAFFEIESVLMSRD